MFWTLLIGVFIVMWQFSQLQNFQQYASGVIARQGGLTIAAVEQIDNESKDHYRGVFRLVDNDNHQLTRETSDSNGKLTFDTDYNTGDFKIKPYGAGIVYKLKASPTVFEDVPYVGSLVSKLNLITTQSTTSLNRNAGAIATDDTSVIGDKDTANNLLPQNETIQIALNDATDPSKLDLQRLLKTTNSITNAVKVDDNKDDTVVAVNNINNLFILKPLSKGSTTVTLKLSLADGNKKSTVTRTYTIVVV